MSNDGMTATYLNVVARIEEIPALYVRSRYDDLQLRRVTAHLLITPLAHTRRIAVLISMGS